MIRRPERNAYQNYPNIPVRQRNESVGKLMKRKRIVVKRKRSSLHSEIKIYSYIRSEEKIIYIYRTRINKQILRYEDDENNFICYKIVPLYKTLLGEIVSPFNLLKRSSG